MAVVVDPKARKEASVSVASMGDNTIIAAASGKTRRIFKIVLYLASSTTVQFKSGTTALTGAMTGTQIVLDMTEWPWFTTAAGEAFIVALGGAVQCSGRVYYTED